MLVENFHDAVSKAELRQGDTEVLRSLFRLFALYTIDTEAREFQSSGAVTSAALDALPDRIYDLMQQIRPHAVRLVDSFALPDYLLDRFVVSSNSDCGMTDLL